MSEYFGEDGHLLDDDEVRSFGQLFDGDCPMGHPGIERQGPLEVSLAYRRTDAVDFHQPPVDRLGLRGFDEYPLDALTWQRDVDPKAVTLTVNWKVEPS